MMQYDCIKCKSPLMKVKHANSWEEIRGMAVTEILTKDCQGHKNGESMICRLCGSEFVGYNREEFWHRVDAHH